MEKNGLRLNWIICKKQTTMAKQKILCEIDGIKEMMAVVSKL
jgi:hypothetical protein